MTAAERAARQPRSAGGAPRRALRVLNDPSSPVLTVAAMVAIAAGLVLIAVGWFQVSGVLNVALQMPYVVSAGLTGLGLIVVGVAMLLIAVKRRDSMQRIRKLDRLEALLCELGGGSDDTVAPPQTPTRQVSWARVATQPAVRAAVVFGAVVVAGVIALGMAWYGVSGTLNVSSQVAYAVSGGVGGLGLVATGAGLLAAHVARWEAAREDAALDRVITATRSVVDADAALGASAGARSTAPRAATTGARRLTRRTAPRGGRDGAA